jgi:hypothetical protein
MRHLAVFGALELALVSPYVLHHLREIRGPVTEAAAGSFFSLASFDIIRGLVSRDALTFHLTYLLPTLALAAVAALYVVARGRASRLREVGVMLAALTFVVFLLEYLTRPLGLHTILDLHLRTFRAAKYYYPVAYAIIAIGAAELFRERARRRGAVYVAVLVCAIPAFMRPADFSFPIGKAMLRMDVELPRNIPGRARIQRWRDDAARWERAAPPYHDVIRYLQGGRRQVEEPLVFIYSGPQRSVYASDRSPARHVYPILDLKAFVLNAYEFYLGDEIGETELGRLESRYLGLLEEGGGGAEDAIEGILLYAAQRSVPTVVLEKATSWTPGNDPVCYDNARFAVYCLPGR